MNPLKLSRNAEYDIPILIVTGCMVALLLLVVTNIGKIFVCFYNKSDFMIGVGRKYRLRGKMFKTQRKFNK